MTPTVDATLYRNTFALLAELAVGLAGFGGVAAAFGGRERSFQATELIRLRAVFFGGGVVLSGALCVETLLAIQPLATLAIPIAGTVSLLAQLVTSATNLRSAYRRASDPGSSSERWALHLSSVYSLTAVVLYVVCIVTGEPWAFIGASTIQLVFSLWMFTRILTRPN